MVMMNPRATLRVKRRIFSCSALVAALVALLTLLLGGLWFASSGTGEVRTSPEDRFTASVSNMSRGTLFGRRTYLEVRIVENASRREVWRGVRHPPPGAKVPSYGSRADRFIVWAAGVSMVTVPVDGGRRLTLAAP